jgi:hypothetical protein
VNDDPAIERADEESQAGAGKAPASAGLVPESEGWDSPAVVLEANRPAENEAVAAFSERAPRGLKASGHNRVMADDDVPLGAITWNDTTERKHALRGWRREVMKKVGVHARAIKVAWLLEGLIATRGYCTASDAYIGAQTDLGISSVQRALVALEDAGLIFRGHIRRADGVFDRRIFPTRLNAEEGEGGTPPRRSTHYATAAPKHTPPRRTYLDTMASKPTKRAPSVPEAALLEAERRDAREKGERPRSWLDD